MPNCFQLFDKSSPDTPVSLALVDERICREVYHVEPHPKFYGSNVFNWYDTIAFTVASGKSLTETREYYNNSDIWEEERPYINDVISFLESNYTTRSFYAVNR